MRDTRLYSYIKGFSLDEWKSFEAYVRYKAPNKKDLIKLSRYAVKHSTRLDSHKFDLEHIKENLFATQSRKYVLNTYSELTKIVMAYLSTRKLEEESSLSSVLLLKSLSDKGLYHQSDLLFKKLTRNSDKQNYNWQHLLHQQLIHHYYFISDNPKNSREDGFKIFQLAIGHLREYTSYLSAFYRFLQQYYIGIGKSGFNDVTLYLPTHSHKNNLINILQEFNSIEGNLSENKLNKTLDLLHEHHNDLASDVRLALFIRLKQVLVKRVNNGDLSAVEHVMNLNRLMIDNDYIQHHGKVDALRILNTISLAAFLNQADWINQVVIKYRKLIPLKTMTDFQHLSLAFLSYSKKNYEKAYISLSQYYPSRAKYKSIAHRLAIISLIESESYDRPFIKTKIDNYRLFLHRNKKGLSTRSYQGSINLCIALHLIVERNDYNKIEQNITNLKPLIYRYYLTSKIKTGILASR